MEIRLTNITKSFGSKQVIAPTTLTVESGSFTTLLGPPAAERPRCCA